jgi:hypothetical protein
VAVLDEARVMTGWPGDPDDDESWRGENRPVSPWPPIAALGAAFAVALVVLILAAFAWGRPPAGVQSSPERQAWFEQQRNQMGGACCSGGETDEGGDGQPLRADEWRQVPPRWDAEAWQKVPPAPADDPSWLTPEGRRGDNYIRWEVKLNGAWWPVHGWQRNDKRRAKDAYRYIHGDAEVWFKMSSWMGGSAPVIYCFLPGRLM